MPLSDSPVILRLLDGPHLSHAIMKGVSLYPRRRLTFNSKINLHEIFRSSEIGKKSKGDDLGLEEWSMRKYATMLSAPALYYGLLMFTRFEVSDPINWLIEASLVGGAIYAMKYIREEKRKMINHIIIGQEFETVVIGVENLTKKAEGVELPDHIEPIPGTTYKSIPFKHVLFVGYSQTYSRVRKGEGALEAEKHVDEVIQSVNEKPSWYVEAFKQGLNKQKLLITIIYFDESSNTYSEGLINPNQNALPELEDYLMSLVQKKKMKFFMSPN